MCAKHELELIKEIAKKIPLHPEFIIEQIRQFRIKSGQTIMEIAVESVATSVENQRPLIDEPLFCLIKIGLPLYEVVMDDDRGPELILSKLLHRTDNLEIEKTFCEVLLASNYKLN